MDQSVKDHEKFDTSGGLTFGIDSLGTTDFMGLGGLGGGPPLGTGGPAEDMFSTASMPSQRPVIVCSVYLFLFRMLCFSPPSSFPP